MRKLFYEDINITEFEATVISCEKSNREGLYKLVLDATAFFPEEGGQSADKGFFMRKEMDSPQRMLDALLSSTKENNYTEDITNLNQSFEEELSPELMNFIEVQDVQIEKEIISHYICEYIEPGTMLSGHVDKVQRFDFMQQHSGEHIISGLVNQKYGYNNVGFHLSINEVTLDFDGVLSLEQLSEIELAANKVIYQNLPIEISYPTNEELENLSYRSKIEIDGQVRIVTIPGIDVCACCAPHVSSTGEIGIIKITQCQSYKGGVRLHILCGERALRDYCEKQKNVSAIAADMSVKQTQICEGYSRLKEELFKQKEAINELQAKYLSLLISTLPSPDEATNVTLFIEAMDNIAVRNAVNSLVEKYSGYCSVFMGSDEEGYRFIAGSSELDCNELAVILRKELSAKCGGSKQMIQGSVAAKKDTITLFLTESDNFTNRN